MMATVTGYGKPERRKMPCERCGFVRLTKFTPRTHNGKPTGDGMFEKHCAACRFDLNALHYDHLANTNRKRASEERSRQALRRLKPYRAK
jgi:hypothetical protein